MQLTVNELIKAVNGKLIYGNLSDTFHFVSTDSRENLCEKLFIPLKGDNFDGHSFITTAIEQKAAGFLTENEAPPNANFAVKVEDTKKALGDLAAYAMTKSNAKVIGITGSVGKTTTRQLIAGVVGTLGKTLATSGNFNNDIGLPLSILKMEGDEKYIVLEMGMNSLGEISYLSKIAKPDIAVITLIGTSHIEFLGSRENILKAKLEILDGLKENGTLLLNGNDPILFGLKNEYKNTKYYGTQNCDYRLEVLKNAPECEFTIDNFTYKINIAGQHNIINASCAVLIGKLLGASNVQIQEGLSNFERVKYRQEIKVVGDKKIILDCYNASLDSDLAALSVLKSMGDGRKVAILGAIGELGENFLEDILNKVGEGVFENKIDLLICIDENAEYIANGAAKAGMPPDKILLFKEKIDFYKQMHDIFKENDTILIKASRKYKFEEIYEKIAPLN